MSKDSIRLFVMHSCQICPQMERLFTQMHNDGAIDQLEIVDIGVHPEIAVELNIRSVPYYLINNIAFYGLKTQTEIIQLLLQGETEKWQEFIKSELSEGQIEPVENAIVENKAARNAMMSLLYDGETSLVVRIGLSAVIESIVDSGLLKDYEQQFIELTEHQEERVAIDAIYYLSLLASQNCIKTLNEIVQKGQENLKSHAVEALQELLHDE